MTDIQEWLDAGYKIWATNKSQLNKLADFGLQKKIEDDKGIRYHITCFCYEQLIPHITSVTVMPTCQFTEADFCTTDITLHTQSIEETETVCNLIWETLGKPYYGEHGE